MKSLVNYIKESQETNESIFATINLAMWVLFYVVACGIGADILRREGYFDGLKKIFAEFADWIFHSTHKKKLQRYIDEVTGSDGYKEWLSLPKKKRTLWRLAELSKDVIGKDEHAVDVTIKDLWQEYKANGGKTTGKADDMIDRNEGIEASEIV